jgi:hypothetical protein
MSAFLVEDETINRVVEWLSWEVTKSPRLKLSVERTLGSATRSASWEQELGHAMFQLNIDAVNDRYGDGEAATFRDFNYSYRPAHGTEIQVLKSPRCWLYQCREGEVVKKSLYRFFDTVVENYLMSKIICALPEYEQAQCSLRLQTACQNRRYPWSGRYPQLP